MAVDVAEAPASQRSRDFSFYLVLFAIVLPLWSVIPLSWIFLVYALGSGKVWHFSWPGQILVTIALSEAIFSIYYFRLTERISRLSLPSQWDFSEIRDATNRIFMANLFPGDGGNEDSLLTPRSLDKTIAKLERDDPRAVNIRNNLRPWFRMATWSSIRLMEVQQWVFWSVYNADMPPLDKLSSVQQTVVKEMVEQLEVQTGCIFPPGSDPRAKPMRPTIDPINVKWRPLSFYIMVGLTNRYLRGWFLNRYSMQYGSHQGLEYLIRIPKAWNNINGPQPILFIHGLGLGLLQYSVVICRLLDAAVDRPVLVLLQPQISQDIFHPRYLKPHSRRQMAEELLSLLMKLGWIEPDVIKTISEDGASFKRRVNGRSLPAPKTRGITVLSHSNGSFVHAWLLKSCPDIVARSCFVDPVAFCLWEGDVCYNFNYRTPTAGTELIMRYFVATELGVANLIQRHFDWMSNSLWYEEIPNVRDPSKTFFLFGGKDSIINAENVIKYLHSHGIKKGVWYDPGGRHGQALITGGIGFNKILEWLEEE